MHFSRSFVVVVVVVVVQLELESLASSSSSYIYLITFIMTAHATNNVCTALHVYILIQMRTLYNVVKLLFSF